MYDILPDPQATCADGKKNRDELEPDCGGKFCGKCPPAPTRAPSVGAYYR